MDGNDRKQLKLEKKWVSYCFFFVVVVVFFFPSFDALISKIPQNIVMDSYRSAPYPRLSISISYPFHNPKIPKLNTPSTVKVTLGIGNCA